MTDLRALIGRQVDRYFTGRRIEQAAANQPKPKNPGR